MDPMTPDLVLASAIYKVGVLWQVLVPFCASVSSVTEGILPRVPLLPLSPPPLQGCCQDQS